jgi:hypothetical protein
MNSYLYDTAETILCSGPDIARHLHALQEACDDAELAAAAVLLHAVESPATAEMRHTADVAEMILSGERDAAVSMHAAYECAEREREDLGASEANLLDLYLAGVLLEADAWRRGTGLPLAV